jgi:predicted acyltransferase
MAANPLLAAADAIAASIKERPPMLAFNVFGTKEIVVYVIVVVIVLILIGWYVMRGRSRA